MTVLTGRRAGVRNCGATRARWPPTREGRGSSQLPARRLRSLPQRARRSSLAGLRRGRATRRTRRTPSFAATAAGVHRPLGRGARRTCTCRACWPAEERMSREEPEEARPRRRGVSYRDSARSGQGADGHLRAHLRPHPARTRVQAIGAR